MDSYTESFGPWQGVIASGAAVLQVPVSAASYDATGLAFAGMARTDATAALLGLSEVVATPAVDTQRNHKSITRPGSPPRGRHR